MSQCSVRSRESKLVRELKGLQEALVVGIDVHKRSYAVAFVRASSKAVAAGITMPADVKALGRLLGRVRERTGCAQKAIVGVARKLVMIMWRMLVDRTRYKPSVAGATPAPAAPARPTPAAT